ncbi:HipA N-terminal domain-containing protein [Prevotella dentasini]|uniref:HipA N-terminal domain-containing protein n=1 Tax=Prevotella dentasini TaxID=589537 RepID=UPI000468B4DE|nr:HipA N-terminal domain-containing protein [Prevotella dentasini]
MIKLKKELKRLFWSESHNNMVVAADDDATFNVNLGKLLVGTLVYADGMWHFSYSNEFKSQSRILPLTNFPSKEKEYSTRHLWPFFASRIPSNAQLQIGKDNQKEDIVTLLRRFGHRTISNPYELLPVRD